MKGIKKKNILGIIFFAIGIVGFVLAGLFFVGVLMYFEFNFRKIINYIGNSLSEFLFLIILFLIDLLLIFIGKKLSFLDIKIVNQEDQKIKNKITKYIIVLTIFITTLLISSPYIYYAFERTFLCAKEGESADFASDIKCCWGLKKVGTCDKNGIFCCRSCAICTKCGNGICNKHENKINCSKDCH